MAYGFGFDELAEVPWCFKHRGIFLFVIVPHSIFVSVQRWLS